MRAFVVLTSVMVGLFLVAPNKVEAQKKATNTSKQSAVVHPPAKCAVVVRNDIVPDKGIVVVGCDSFGIHEALFTDMQGKRPLWPSNGGIIVFDADLNVLLKYEACTACGGFFDSFAGVKKIKGRNALMVQLVNGPRLDATGVTSVPIVPLYFDGKRLRFIDVEAQ